jgi:carbamoyltransferase
MKILGVCNAIDSGAALILDGEIVAAVNEERLTREKLTKAFPAQSIQYVLDSAGISIAEIDYVGCGAWSHIDLQTTLPLLVEDIYDQCARSGLGTQTDVLERVRKTGQSDSGAKAELEEGLRELGVDATKVVFCDHHYSHALTAFYCSPFDEAIVFSADGRGDFRSVTLWQGSRRHGLKLLDMATELTSPGALYGLITKYLGFTPFRHEGKVTGLSAHGKPTAAYDLLRRAFYFDGEAGRLRSEIGPFYKPFASASLPELDNALAGFSREDVAFAVQKVTEEALSAFLVNHIDHLDPDSVNLCLAGGCMANVRLNQELDGLKPIRNTYVFPQMGDGGNALGGAISVALSKERRATFHMPSVYLGPEYDDEEIRFELEEHSLGYERLDPSSKVERAVELLRSGKIIGWFQGRMEYGPRALGARSILAPATDPAITEELNGRLQRSDFMPFGPVAVADIADRCFVGWQKDQIASRFMTICYPCTDFFKEACPAVVHVDGTARPQIIFREDNPEYYDVIKMYTKQTGIPALINTSFNHHEEPIVSSPSDAVRSIQKGNVDSLIVGNYLVEA